MTQAFLFYDPSNGNKIYDLKNANFSGSTLAKASFDYTQLVGTASSNFDALSGTIFNNADISGAYFNYATAHGFTEPQLQSTASYKNSDLSGIDLSRNTLRDWNFQGQDLTNASFKSSMLGGADLTGANLTNASFDSAALTNAKFDNANISGAIFNFTTGIPIGIFNSGITQAQLQSTASYQNKDLSGIQLQKNTLTGWDFHGQNLTGASFVSAALSSADFTQATLTNASLNSAALSGAIFTDAVISGANFDFATARGFTQAQLQSTQSYNTDKDLSGIKLAGNDLTNWDFHGQNLTNASFCSGTLFNATTSATLKGAIFTDAVVSGANFSFSTFRGFTQAQLQSTKSYQDKDLSGIQLQGNNLSGWDFNGQNLTGAFFNFSMLAGANFNKATFTNASFVSADLSNANLSQANLANSSFASANLSGVDFTDATINGDMNNPGADFSKTTGLTSAQLQSTSSYKNKNLFGVILRADNLRGCDFNGQNLVNVNFAGADLSGANFANADIRGTADSTSGTIFPTIFFCTPNLTEAQIQSTSSYQQHDLSFIRFSMNDVSGWDFHGQSLLYTSFAASKLTGAVFTDADVRGTDFSDFTGFTQAQLQATASYKNQDLSAIKFQGDNLTKWDFNGQNLSSADFNFSTLTKANISNATILGASFSNTTDKGFTLSQLQSTKSYNTDKDLSGIQLGGDNLTSWDFQGQNLTSASFVNLTRNAVYPSTLNGADFTQANLTSAQLSGSTAIAANFTQADLTNASFFATLSSGATLSSTLNNANFTQANLANVNFQSASLASANFTAADTRGSTGINFAGTTVVNTIRPDGSIQGGLDLSAGQTLIVRNYTSDSSGKSASIPITVQTKFNMGTAGILQMVFDDQDWKSTISFDSGIPVTLGGTLKLTFKDGVDVTKLGTPTFDLFDWTGVNLNGTKFSTVDQGSYTWDLTKLYTDGTVTFEGQTTSNAIMSADSSANGLAAGNDLSGAPSGDVPALSSIAPVPEPASLGLLIMGLFSLVAWKFRRGKQTASV